MAKMLTIRMYSIVRELAGKESVTVQVDPNVTIASLLESVIGNLIDELKSRNIPILLFDENGRKINLNDKINNIKIIHVMPPPSGGSKTILTGMLKDNDYEKIIKNIIEEFGQHGKESITGAIVFFIGVVRKINNNSNVIKLIYETAEDLANKKLHELAEEYINNPNITGVAAYHYYGERRPGDITMIVAVAGRSRKDTFPVLMELVDRIKHEVPIWKKEVREGETVFIIGDKEEKI